MTAKRSAPARYVQSYRYPSPNTPHSAIRKYAWVHKAEEDFRVAEAPRREITHFSFVFCSSKNAIRL